MSEQTTEKAEVYYCADCTSRGIDTVMVNDDGAGYLCPVCDVHPRGQCGNGFPCSGYDGKPCVLNIKDATDLGRGRPITTWDVESAPREGGSDE